MTEHKEYARQQGKLLESVKLLRAKYIAQCTMLEQEMLFQFMQHQPEMADHIKRIWEELKEDERFN